jgi:hypothetical protein
MAATKRPKTNKTTTKMTNKTMKKAAKKRAPRRKAKIAAAKPAGALDARTVIDLESAVLRRLLKHFDERKDVQNIELMILAGFCRNCLSKWFVEAANERGLTVDIDAARARVYGMPYDEWKSKHQQPATDDQLRRFEAAERAKK